ncbi:hypothetical protein JHK82_012554 [Glycine max]|nr:hypothetical protein JHK82_012554 [Glycine max]
MSLLSVGSCIIHRKIVVSSKEGEFMLLQIDCNACSGLSGERKDIELVEEEEPKIVADCSSETSNKFEIYKEEAVNAAQKHKPKRVESVNADAEAFGYH